MKINGIVLSSIIITNILTAVPNDIQNESRRIGSGEVLLEMLIHPDVRVNMFGNVYIRGVASGLIYDSYVEYCNTLEVEVLDRKDIWIRGWFARLEQGHSIGMHSHAIHENAFVSGNMALHKLEPSTYTDYWIPLFSLYHGYFRVLNKPGAVTFFPSWLQHRVDRNPSSKVRYTLAFDLFNEYNFKYIRKTETSDTDLAKIILLSTKL